MGNLVKPSCEQIIDIMPDPFVVIDQDFIILAANRAYLERFGRHQNEVVGQYCYKVSHRSDVPCSQHGELCPLEEVFRLKRQTQVMHVHYDADGQEEFVQLRATPVFSNEGEVLYMGETIQPISPIVEDDNALVGHSGPWLHLLGLLQRAAPTDATVMLLGESGVGKERVAEYLHQFSKRLSGPFMVLDCGAINASLIETELFGHEKSAFTGAHKLKKGLFEAANGGTLFIDEIGEMPLALQTRLLRALETGKVRRVGGTDYIDVNVRVIAATNRKLEDMVKDGLFRSDLYYRLAAFPVHIPPLREHRDDIPALAEYFLSLLPDGDKLLPLSPELIEALLDYDYPGNVRELRNIIERAVILADDGVLRSEHLMISRTGANHYPANEHQLSVGKTNDHLFLRSRPDEVQIMAALAESGGHRGKAAKLLSIGERSLYRYINDLKKKNTGD